MENFGTISSKKIVLTFGSFDRLHLGHQYYLSQARSFGDYLVTILARDSTILKVKGRLPSYHESLRFEKLCAMSRSDEVVLGREGGFEWCLYQYKPYAVCLGYDQGDVSGKLAKLCDSLGIRLVRIASYHPHRWKSSLLKQ